MKQLIEVILSLLIVELDRVLKREAYEIYQTNKRQVAEAAKNPNSPKLAKVESKSLEQVYDELLDYFHLAIRIENTIQT